MFNIHLPSIFWQLITHQDRYTTTVGGSFIKIQDDSQLSNAIIGEVAMTCMAIMVFLLVAINNKSRSPDGPFIVGLTVAAALLAGWDKRTHWQSLHSREHRSLQLLWVQPQDRHIVDN